MPAPVTAALVMFLITVLFVAVFMFPMTRFPQKNKLVNFYWSGFWLFLAMITAFAGGQSTLTLLGQNVSVFSEAMLGALTLTFVLFVLFGWVRLMLSGAGALLKRAAVSA